MAMTHNQQYKEYKKEGGHLTYKELRRVSDMAVHLNTAGDFSAELAVLSTAAGITPKPQTDLENKYIFGINRNVFIWGGVALVLGTGIYLYLKYHKK